MSSYNITGVSGVGLNYDSDAGIFYNNNVRVGSDITISFRCHANHLFTCAVFASYGVSQYGMPTIAQQIEIPSEPYVLKDTYYNRSITIPASVWETVSEVHIWINATSFGSLSTSGSDIDYGGHTGDSIVLKLSDSYQPSISIENITPYLHTYNGYVVAGITSIKTRILSSSPSQGASKVSEYVYSLNSYYSLPTVTIDDKTYYYTTPPMNSMDQYASMIGYISDSRQRSKTDAKNILVKGYFLPRLVVNTSGENTYISRCDAEGHADGLGEYGHLHLKWETALIDGTNTLVSAVVTLNNEVTLVPTDGSIAEGYLDYIFPVGVETQGNLKIVLTDHIRSNTIASQVVPKGAMPMSLYDDGGEIGVAYGRMATQGGVWMYLPFYLKSSTPGSAKMFHIQVDDSGKISAVAVTNN